MTHTFIFKHRNMYLHSFQPLVQFSCRVLRLAARIDSWLKKLVVSGYPLSSLSMQTCRLVRALSSDYGVGQWELGASLSLVWLIRALLQVKLRTLKRWADELRAVPSLQFLGLGSSSSPGPYLLQPVIYNSPLEWVRRLSLLDNTDTRGMVMRHTHTPVRTHTRSRLMQC